MLVVCSEPIEEVLASFDTKGVGILSEVAVLEHVIDIVPDRFERNSGCPIIVDHILRFTPILVALYYWSAYVILVDRASIAERPRERDENRISTYPTTLVEAETPVGLHGR
jgi:hypothetical protein